MCADFFDLKNCIRQFEESKIDMLHVDIMDGSFVPNYTLGTDFVKILKANTAIPLDIQWLKIPKVSLIGFNYLRMIM